MLKINTAVTHFTCERDNFTLNENAIILATDGALAGLGYPASAKPESVVQLRAFFCEFFC